jgi:hypothetical protein
LQKPNYISSQSEWKNTNLFSWCSFRVPPCSACPSMLLPNERTVIDSTLHILENKLLTCYVVIASKNVKLLKLLPFGKPLIELFVTVKKGWHYEM